MSSWDTFDIGSDVNIVNEFRRARPPREHLQSVRERTLGLVPSANPVTRQLTTPARATAGPGENPFGLSCVPAWWPSNAVCSDVARPMNGSKLPVARRPGRRLIVVI